MFNHITDKVRRPTTLNYYLIPVNVVIFDTTTTLYTEKTYKIFLGCTSFGLIPQHLTHCHKNWLWKTMTGLNNLIVLTSADNIDICMEYVRDSILAFSESLPPMMI